MEKRWIFKKKSRFQNPVRQNYGHVKTLQSLFTLPEDNFVPAVVFTGDAEFKTDLGPCNSNGPEALPSHRRDNERKAVYRSDSGRVNFLELLSVVLGIGTFEEQLSSVEM
jgi:hypothetical protein